MTGIAAFINGGVDGINMRQQWDDRKRRQALEDERMGWSREDRTYNLGQRERSLAEQRRTDAEAARMRSILQAGTDRVDASYDGQNSPGTERTLLPVPAPAEITETTLPPIGQARAAAGDTPEAVAYDAARALQDTPINGAAQADRIAGNENPLPGYLGTGVSDPQDVEAESARLEQMRVDKELSLMPPEPDSPTGPSTAPITASEQVADAVVQQERSIAPNGNANTPVEVQRERATQSYVQMWNEQVMPDVIREMLRTGRVEDARKFETFMRTDATQQGMALLANMAFSANLGDLDGTLDSASELYNLPGYYDDGYSVVRDQSGWAQDDQGNTTGINIAFRNDQTGEVFMRNFAGQDELVRAALQRFDPEQTFKDGIAAVNAERSAQAGQERSLELIDARNQGRGGADQGAADQGGISRENIDKAMKLLGQDLSFGQLPLEEQIQKAVEYINQREAAFAAGTGSLGAVAGAPPPVWTGD